MADIQKYLDDIKSAVYGEEVRGSIHDAIKAIDEEVGGVGGSTKILDTSTWDSDKYNPTQYYRIIAKVKPSVSAHGAMSNQSVSFNAENTNIPYSSSEILWITFKSGSVWPSFVYLGMQLNGGLSSNIFSDLKTFFYQQTTESEVKPEVYLAMTYHGVASGNIVVSNLRISPDIEEFEWLWDENKYIDKTQCGTVGYEFYHYISYNPYALQYDPIVSSNYNGVAPRLPSSHKNNLLLGTNGSGILDWYPISSLGFQTSAQVDTKIAEAITEANVPQFVELDHIPTVEEAEPNKFYLVKNEDTGHYDIYALLGEKVELIDDTTVDLSNYTTLTDEQYNALIQLLGEE